jgi:hypothetical protein
LERKLLDAMNDIRKKDQEGCFWERWRDFWRIMCRGRDKKKGIL